MCRAASFIVLPKRVLWSKKTDSHTEIRLEHNIREEEPSKPILGVAVEITPPGERYDVPEDQWTFRVDQDLLPKWWNAADGETRARKALKDWIKARVFTEGLHQIGDSSIWAYGKADVRLHGNSVGRFADDSQGTIFNKSEVSAHNNAHLHLFDRSSGRFYDNSYGWVADTATALFRDKSTGECSGHSYAITYDNAKVTGHGYSRIVAAERSTVRLYDCSIGERDYRHEGKMENHSRSSVIIDRRIGLGHPPTCYTGGMTPPV